jgi:hypothetical protein
MADILVTPPRRPQELTAVDGAVIPVQLLTVAGVCDPGRIPAGYNNNQKQPASHRPATVLMLSPDVWALPKGGARRRGRKPAAHKD